ncbi:MAG: hypothetical protein IPN38_05280 [Flavobacteriales bacterium]|nr:hypothetical protein [Flavobacteriales bacterium]
MDTKEYTRRNSNLFDKWNSELRKDTHAVLDGAVDPVRYFDPANTPRILFVMKEMNATFWEPVSLLQYLREDNTRAATWNNVVRWTRLIRGVLNGTAEQELLDFDTHPAIDHAERMDELGRVAVLNLKKIAGTSDSHMPTIDKHAERYGKLLGEQFALLDPDVVVACGVRLTDIHGLQTIAQPKANWLRTTVGGKPRTFIWSHHPQARGKDRTSFAFMVEACQAALGDQTPV